MEIEITKESIIELFTKYKIYRLPTTVCLDKYGREVKRVEGFSNLNLYMEF